MRAFAASALHPSLPASQRGLRLARAQGPTGHGSVMEGGMRWRQSVLLVRAQARGARRLFQFLPKSAGEPECSGTPAPGSAPANPDHQAWPGHWRAQCQNSCKRIAGVQVDCRAPEARVSGAGGFGRRRPWLRCMMTPPPSRQRRPTAQVRYRDGLSRCRTTMTTFRMASATAGHGSAPS